MNLDGYLGALGQLPSYAQMQSAAATLRGQKLDNQFREGQIGAQEQAQQQEAAFEADVKALGANPTVEGLRRLAVRYPKFSEGINSAATGMDKQRTQQVISDSSQMFSALGGKTPSPQLAASILKRHIDADKAAGREPDLTDTAMLEMVESGDPEKIKAARGMIYATINGLDTKAAAALAETSGGLPIKGTVVGRAVGHYDETGKWQTDYRDPDPERFLTVNGVDANGNPITSVVRVGGNAEGGDPASSGPGVVAPSSGNPRAPSGRYAYGWTPRARNGGDNPDNVVDNKITGMATALGVGPDDSLSGKTPMEIARALAISEGGPGTLADKNNNPGNLTNPKTGAFRRFPSKEAGLAAAAAQVARNRARGQNTIRSMVEGLPVGGAAATPQSGSSVVFSTPGKEKPKGTPMTREEVAAEGLDPNMVYYRGADGIPKAVSGQTRNNAQAKPWPAVTLSARITNDASLENIDQAIKLLDPKNNSAAAKDARSGVGIGTGALGEQFTNWNDPRGTSIRALIGQIGGIIIKDISGAAVSVAEDARLSKWVPKVTDSPQVITYKIQNLKREIALRNTVMDRVGKSQGYRPFTEEKAASSPSAPTSGGWGKAVRVQ